MEDTTARAACGAIRDAAAQSRPRRCHRSPALAGIEGSCMSGTCVVSFYTHVNDAVLKHVLTNAGTLKRICKAHSPAYELTDCGLACR